MATVAIFSRIDLADQKPLVQYTTLAKANWYQRVYTTLFVKMQPNDSSKIYPG